MNWKSS